MLHREQPSSNEVAEDTPATEPASVNTITPAKPSVSFTSLMMTSQVIMEAPFGKMFVARALLDSGASMSVVSDRAVQCLQLPKTPQAISLSGAQRVQTGVSHHTEGCPLHDVSIEGGQGKSGQLHGWIVSCAGAGDDCVLG